MNRVKPIDIAKWFISQNIEGIDNSKEGNMKLQKLLFFAQMIYMYKNNNKTMFNEEFNAFKQEMVLQEVLWKYKENFKELPKEAMNTIEIPEDIETILIETKDIFGKCTAEELSRMTHELKAWNKYYGKSLISEEKYEIPYKDLEQDLYRIKKILDAYYREKTLEKYSDEEDY